MAKVSISEVLSKINSVNKKNIVDALQANDSPPIRSVLAYALDPRVVWLLPEGAPPYRPSGLSESAGMLFQEQRLLYLFVEGLAPPNLSQNKREIMFVQLLETIDPKDAEMLIAIKDGQFNKLFKNLTRDTIDKAFPGLIPKEAVGKPKVTEAKKE